MALHSRIRLARVTAGRAPKEMAAALEVSVGTYERIESGKRRVRRIELEAIARLTRQNIAFFDTSAEAEGGVLPDPLPLVNQDSAA